MTVAFCLHQAITLRSQRLLSLKIVGKNIGVTSDAYLRTRKEPFECDWYPESTSDCNTLLNSRLPLGNQPTMNKKRWLFFGDSTMKRLFEHSPLKNHLVVGPNNRLAEVNSTGCWSDEKASGMTCREKMADRCQLNDFFDLPYAEEWREPEVRPGLHKFEGPLKYGLENHYCTDCSGCKSNLLECQVDDTADIAQSDDVTQEADCARKHLTYGGFISIEFAKDVEVQTPRYTTTQENVAWYLQRSWNQPTSKVMKEWGLPICVINTGNHDVILPFIQTSDFIKNVEWYLNLFVNECSHFVWLSNTAPSKEGASHFPQKEELMREYDNEVKKLIKESRTFREMSSFVNIFDPA